MLHLEDDGDGGDVAVLVGTVAQPPQRRRLHRDAGLLGQLPDGGVEVGFAHPAHTPPKATSHRPGHTSFHAARRWASTARSPGRRTTTPTGPVPQAPGPHLRAGDDPDHAAVVVDDLDQLHPNNGRFPPMSIYDVAINNLDGSKADLHDYEGKAVLVVNVASKCGLTPQYEGLERLHESLAGRGFTVLGVPCNQFLGQEPGTAEEIAEFCSATYGVTFPLTEKIEVNGDARHPLYEQLTPVADGEGHTGDIRWNFEKFLLSPAGEVVGRFRPRSSPRRPRSPAPSSRCLPS